ncbi:MAG: efflux RND transporter periplasmic adaptor subunit [Tagaea sp.]
MSAAAAMGGGEAALPPLRDELGLIQGGRTREGAPTWTLHDPVAGRWFRIGWLEFEILARWHLGDAKAVAARVAQETPLRAGPDDVEALAKFLVRAELVKVAGAKALESLAARLRDARKSPVTWAIKNYLFIRVPLWRPDSTLTRLAPALSFLYGPVFLALTLAAGAAGLYLVSRQWDTFLGTFPYFLSLEGAAYLFLAVASAKCLHEFGHGLTAKRHGARVPSMGLAFMVLYPTLYTDTSAVYALPERRKRLAVGAAGMGAELTLACWALLAWNLLPEGPLRSIVFFWATSSWILSLIVNLSPFLRFDGYYLFADLIEVENLQERSFALARWRLREFLFGCGEAPPEAWSGRMRALLIGYAIGTWMYRFFLFLGIAIMVYFLFFKALGIVMFAIEIWWFILKPVVAEMKEWGKIGAERRFGKRAWITLAVLLAGLGAAFVPWTTHVGAPALLVAQTRANVSVEVTGRLEVLLVTPGDWVEAGQTIARFASPDLEHRLAQTERRAATLRREAAALVQEAGAAARAQIVWREMERAEAEAASLRADAARLTVEAPVPGTVVEIAEPLRAGEWLRAGEFLVAIVDLSGPVIDAYVDEANLRRIAIAAEARLTFEDPSRPPLRARVAEIVDTSARHLPDPELASIHGGRIPVRQGPAPEHRLVPETPVYRVRLAPEAPTPAFPAMRGAARIDAEPESFAVRIWRIAYGLAVRESGF